MAEGCWWLRIWSLEGFDGGFSNRCRVVFVLKVAPSCGGFLCVIFLLLSFFFFLKWDLSLAVDDGWSGSKGRGCCAFSWWDYEGIACLMLLIDCWRNDFDREVERWKKLWLPPLCVFSPSVLLSMDVFQRMREPCLFLLSFVSDLLSYLVVVMEWIDCGRMWKKGDRRRVRPPSGCLCVIALYRKWAWMRKVIFASVHLQGH